MIDREKNPFPSQRERNLDEAQNSTNYPRIAYLFLLEMRYKADEAAKYAQGLADWVDAMTCPEEIRGTRCLHPRGHTDFHYTAENHGGTHWGSRDGITIPPITMGIGFDWKAMGLKDPSDADSTG